MIIRILKFVSLHRDSFAKKMFHTKSILGAISPIQLMERVHGIAPFVYSIKKYKSKAQYSKPWLTFNSCFILFYTYSLSETTFNNQILKNEDVRPLLRIKKVLQTNFPGFLMLLLIPLINFSKNKNAETIQNLIETDNSIKCLNVDYNYMRMKKKILFIIIVYYCYQFISFQLQFVSELVSPDASSFYFFTSFMTPVLSFSLIITVFSMYVYIAHDYLVIINKEMLKLITNSEENVKSISAITPKYISLKTELKNFEEIRKIWKAYGDVSNFCYSIDKTWSYKLLLIFAGTFIMAIFNLNHVLEKITMLILGQNISQDDTFFSLVSLHQIISQVLIVMIPSISCNNCHEQVNKFVYLLFFS